jgi:dipeptidyl aminopeptidase/acylaminoacyl peptidase
VRSSWNIFWQGDNDRTVPSNQSEALHAAFKSAGVPSTIHIISGAGHGGPEFSKPKIRRMQREFLLQLLPNTDRK